MINTARARVGNAMLWAANLLARGAKHLNNIDGQVVRADKGFAEIELSVQVPGFVRGIRLDVPGTNDCEIVKVVTARGRRVRIDRKLAHQYPKGAFAKLLV